MPIVKYRNFEKKVDENQVEFYLKQGYKLVGSKEQEVKNDEKTPEKKPLSNMKIDELKMLAEERGIEDYESLTKSELLEVLK